ncbi:helix-turn-helix transcriptional regulator [Natrialbaceae archaeon GCM10025896]
MDTATVHGTNPAWYLLGTIVAASIVAGVYIGVRERISSPSTTQNELPPSSEESDQSDSSGEFLTERVTSSDRAPNRSVLDLLPDDERRILEPVLESPGLTQIELRDRSDFSKSKISQTVTALEKRGLLYREPQGRTYRVYPSDDLERDR